MHSRRALNGSLAAATSAFVGRRREISAVKDLLSESRVVTLTGSGGVGKTRLALRVSEQLRRAYRDGVWLIDLTLVPGPNALVGQPGDSPTLGRSAADPQRVAAVVAQELGLAELAGHSPMQVLAEYLASRRMLLVLDNCEHLIEAAAALTERLLRACPPLRVLTTSREPLGITGETLFEVPPLPTPSADAALSSADLARCESVALFLARAEKAVPGFTLDEDNREAVAGICRRLDGVPLAIELAAARLTVLAPEQILDRLTNRFALLRRRTDAGPDRQHTLRACVDWSFELCSKQERRLWARLSVFAGGCEIDAVEAVCADELPAEDLAVDELLDVVADLVDKSILVREEHRGEVRYRMLETIREYGSEQLSVAGERELLRRRHRDWYQQLVARAETDVISPRQLTWLVRLDRELPNIRTAMEYCLSEPGEATAALEMAAALDTLWWRGRANEGRRWLERALAAQTEEATPTRVRAMYEVTKLAVFQGDLGPALAATDRLGQLAEQLGDPRFRAWAGTMTLGVQVYAGDPTHAAAEAAALLAAHRAHGDLPMLLDGLLAMSFAYWAVGAWDRAAACHEEVLTITAPRGETWYRSMSLLHLGIVRWRQGEVEQATELARDSLRLRVSIDELRSSVQCLAVLAWIAGHKGEHHRAAVLLGATDALSRNTNTPVTALPGLLASHAECERHARRALGDQTFEAAFAHGCDLPTEDVIEYALGEATSQVGTPGSPELGLAVAAPGEVTALTRREWQVAELVAAGLSNKEIAAKLVIAVRTAESHVDHILTKLSLANRAQIASWVIIQRQSDATR